MKNVKFYICAHCGNAVEKVHDAGVKRPMCSSPPLGEKPPVVYAYCNLYGL